MAYRRWLVSSALARIEPWRDAKARRTEAEKQDAKGKEEDDNGETI